ncbi:diploid state maintenance protein chpA [Microthyrium microscopicum]|uniref:Diploid state maintenance protein chpA n=1 Tax=Microthyrium microscopicum TaxID=703497 RepID=A0A6A6U8E4_9PEZI|nr:diploid state maintenance protein chpA [Microthyrium microscopicum]
MAQKCVHKGCGKTFTDPKEPCVYHSGPPIFHEGQKGWSCCKPRVLTFDEFLSIPPCTTGEHSTIDDTPPPLAKDIQTNEPEPPKTLPSQPSVPRIPNPPSAAPTSTPAPAPALESESDDPELSISQGATCRRRACGKTYDSSKNRDDEQCVHHPGSPVFHEGSKGWSCCKRRVLEFDEFMKIEGCKTKAKHLFVGKTKKPLVEKLDTVRCDFYQTVSSVIASVYLKNIDKEKSIVKFKSASEVDLDLHTSDSKEYTTTFSLFGTIIPDKSTFKILGTKLELNLAKADGIGWPVLRSTDPHTGEIIQSGRAGRA